MPPRALSHSPAGLFLARALCPSFSPHVSYGDWCLLRQPVVRFEEHQALLVRHTLNEDWTIRQVRNTSDDGRLCQLEGDAVDSADWHPVRAGGRVQVIAAVVEVLTPIPTALAKGTPAFPPKDP